MTIDKANFYIMTPMDNCECLRMNIKTIPSESAKEHDLDKIDHNGWVHVETRKGACGLPQAGMLANDLLK